MKVPGPEDRPYYEGWAPGKTRTLLSKGELKALNEQRAVYSRQRFKVGRRFQLLRDYGGIPKGTKVTVVKGWPRTMVRFDRWSKRDYGPAGQLSDLSYTLDDCLEYLEHE